MQPLPDRTKKTVQLSGMAHFDAALTSSDESKGNEEVQILDDDDSSSRSSSEGENLQEISSKNGFSREIWDGNGALDFSERSSILEPEEGVVGFAAQAQQDLQAVLQEIDDQETQQQQQPPPNSEEALEDILQDDERRAEAAVLEIQQEMNQVNPMNSFFTQSYAMTERSEKTEKVPRSSNETDLYEDRKQ